MNTQQLPNKLVNLASQPAVLAGLVLLVALICAAVTYQRLSTPVQSQPQKIKATLGASANTGLSVPEIIAMELFGSTSSDNQVAPNHQDIPETNLKLVLKGAFSHSDSKQASALIATDKGKRAELYFIDAELPGNATLKEVHPSYVVLSRAGRLEKLLFFRSQGLIDPDSNKVHRSQTQNNNPASTGYVAPQQAAPASTKKSDASSLSLGEIREYVRKQKEQQ